MMMSLIKVKNINETCLLIVRFSLIFLKDKPYTRSIH